MSTASVFMACGTIFDKLKKCGVVGFESQNPKKTHMGKSYA